VAAIKNTRHGAACLQKSNLIDEFPEVGNRKVCLMCGLSCGSKQDLIQHYCS
jgi:hypothetical protein